MAVIARVGYIGDTHASCNDYGAHRDYAKESIENFRKITQATEEYGLTHLIGSGDFSYGKFNNLAYRSEIEKELIKQNELTNGNRYEVKGNHDSATNGMTEYEFYVEKGLLKPSTNLTLGRLHISMLDYKKSGKYGFEEFNKGTEEGAFNMVVAHQYFKFSDTRLPNFGEAIELDRYLPMLGVDLLICGHIHKIMSFSGIVSDGKESGNKLMVRYLGCLNRPAYKEGSMDTIGEMDIIEVNDDNSINYQVVEIPLMNIEDAFNIEQKEAEKEKRQLKDERIDISDIVHSLDNHERNMGNPEDVIRGLEGVDARYKDKAIEFLSRAINM